MLSLIEIRDKLNEAAGFIESKNFYFETHECQTKQSVKVNMDFKLKDDIKGEIVKFGFCPVCNICYYHNDFEGSRS